jgi:TRAP-type mannitol/chloroaromatic compound transport system permease small subunit
MGRTRPPVRGLGVTGMSNSGAGGYWRTGRLLALAGGVAGLALGLAAQSGAIIGAATTSLWYPYSLYLPGILVLAGAALPRSMAAVAGPLTFIGAVIAPFEWGIGSLAGIAFVACLLGAGLLFTDYYLALSRVIDAVNFRVGKYVSWLVLIAVLISASNATVRKLFDISSNSWLELQWVLFSMVFLLCSPWTLLSNEHIRIDIVNNLLPPQLRNWIDVVGHAFFLLPLTIIMVFTGVPFFTKSLLLNEQSGNAGGLPQWPAKSLIMIGFALLFLQGVSELIKRIAVMRDLIPDPYAVTGTSHAAIEAEAERLIAELKSEPH